MTAALSALLFGSFAGVLGAWALVRRDARLQDFRRVTGDTKDPSARARTRWGWPLTGATVLCLLLSGVKMPEPIEACLGLLVAAVVMQRFWESGSRRARQGQMRCEWPLLLEGMSVAALSGLDLTSAFLTAARRVEGALRQEVDKASVRVAGGMQLSAALRTLAKDGVPGAERLRALLLQCEVLGTPVAEVLQALALEAATVERQEVEGRFNALPLKMSVVTVLFLLPPVLIVSIAPHVLAFLNSRW